MLQNPPENPNLANVDIFDGFGNAGMAQPPPMQMDMEPSYDQKFTPEEYEQQYATAMELKQQQQQQQPPQQHSTPESQGSSTQSQQPAADMNSSYVSSPGIMSTGADYTAQMASFNTCTPMSDMMSPIGHQQPHIPQQPHLHSSHPHQQAPQQQQQQPPYMYDGMSPHHMQHSQMPIGNLRQPQPPRQHSFQVQTPMRPVGDFQGLQQPGQDSRQSMVGMASMSTEIDFGALQ
jgi:hypothetical protein